LEQVLQILRDHSFLKQADRQVSINVFDSPWVGEQMPQKIECLATWNSISARRAKPVQRKSAFVPLATSASYLLKPGTPVIIQDMATDERVDNKLRAFYLRWLNARSAIYIPLTAAGQFIGYIEAVYREPAMPSEADVRRLMNITGQAAVAVQSIRQFEETRVRAHREQVLREIAATISASQDFLAVSLSDIGWYMHELLPVDTLTVATVRPDDKEYSLYASSPDIDADTLPTQCIRHPLKDSVIGWVVKNGQPRLDKDIRQEQNFVEDARHAAAGWAARLVVPLSTAGQIVGTLNLFNAQPGAFTGEQFELVQPIAEQMAIALERARLLEETRTALAEVEATQRRYLRTQWENYLASAVERATGYLDGPTGLVPISPVQAGSATGELISVPLKVRGEPIGVMEFYSESAERAWTDEERALVETLADQAALALENARLFEDTQSRAQREHLIGEITGKIRASMDMETILRTTTEELARTLNLSRARVRLGPGRTESAE
jgi:GAF domain-containing protein